MYHAISFQGQSKVYTGSYTRAQKGRSKTIMEKFYYKRSPGALLGIAGWFPVVPFLMHLPV